jgi:transcriptional regulator with XRE-family HTH domain
MRLTQEELGGICGLTRASINNLELCRNDTTSQTWATLSDVLTTPLPDLWEIFEVPDEEVLYRKAKDGDTPPAEAIVERAEGKREPLKKLPQVKQKKEKVSKSEPDCTGFLNAVPKKKKKIHAYIMGTSEALAEGDTVAGYRIHHKRREVAKHDPEAPADKTPDFYGTVLTVSEKKCIVQINA